MPSLPWDQVRRWTLEVSWAPTEALLLCRHKALDSEELTPITRGPSYDETTIFSPDESLGMLMTARASRGTVCHRRGRIDRLFDASEAYVVAATRTAVTSAGGR